jgi:exo-beta-1,3-glucanase (GH17 family)
MAQFATIIASRYDGKHSHGKIDSFEIGNEEYDQHFTGDAATSEECRKAANYGPVLKAGYQAIKAVYPDVTVGMFGQWLRNIDHINTFFNDLFSGGYGAYMDYMNFHFYNGGQDPSQSHGNVPSFDLWWQTIHNLATKYGLASKPIWVTEVGWPTHPTIHPEQPVAPNVQAQYLQYIMQQASQSHVVQKVFWFTIDYGNQGDSIYLPTGPLPAFASYQAIVRQIPVWS